MVKGNREVRGNIEVKGRQGVRKVHDFLYSQTYDGCHLCVPPVPVERQLNSISVCANRHAEYIANYIR